MQEESNTTANTKRIILVFIGNNLNLKVGVGIFTSKAISRAIFQRIYTPNNSLLNVYSYKEYYE